MRWSVVRCRWLALVTGVDLGPSGTRISDVVHSREERRRAPPGEIWGQSRNGRFP